MSFRGLELEWEGGKDSGGDWIYGVNVGRKKWRGREREIEPSWGRRNGEERGEKGKEGLRVRGDSYRGMPVV
jgi:hypothetical protein